MIFTTSLENISTEMLTGFFEGWPYKPSPEKHLTMLQNSYKVVLAIEQGRQQVVGFVNAVSDGVMSAYIPFIEVLPEYRGKAIGKQLLELMKEQLRDLYMVDLLCDENLQPYYEKIGMMKAHGMMIRNYTALKGL